MTTSLVDQVSEMQRIGEMYIKGMSETEIAKSTGITRAKVKKYLVEFRGYLRQFADEHIDFADRIKLMIEEVDQSWQKVKKEAWSNKEDAENNGNFAAVNQALKLIADIEKTRLHTFNEVLGGQDEELIRQMRKTQEDQETLVEILKELTDKYPETKDFIKRRLAKIRDEVEVIDVSAG